MLTLVLLSCLISIVTLVVRLRNPKEPENIQIPTAYLGSQNPTDSKFQRWTPPPIWPWVLIFLVTLGTALAYLPGQTNMQIGEPRKKAFVWIDPTFSAKVALKNKGTTAASIAEQLSELALDAYTFDGNNYTSLASNPEALVQEFFNKPVSVYEDPIDADPASQKWTDTFGTQPISLVLVTDGQASTVQKWRPLRERFAQVEVITLAPPAALMGKEVEWIPKTLFANWSLGNKSIEGTDAMMADDYGPFDGHWIPQQARPQLFLENLEGLAFLKLSQAREYPMITACSAVSAGPMENDSMADLRSIARFFKTTVRSFVCKEKTEQQPTADADPWHYRSRSVWVVPLTDERYGMFYDRQTPWIPEGFQSRIDTLVYTGTAELELFENRAGSVMQKSIVQLEKDSLPIPLWLLPEPKSDYKIAVKAEDGTPIAMEVPTKIAEDNISVYLLRTNLASSNGELGHSPLWTRFWLNMQSQNRENTGIRQIKLKDRSDTQSDVLAGAEFYDPTPKKWVKPQEFSPGIYRSKDTEFMLSIPDAERQLNFLSGSQIKDLFALKDSDSVVTQASPIPWRAYVGAVVAVAAAIGLWSLQRLAVFALLMFFIPKIHAESDVSPPTMPFRVGWCDAVVPSTVQERYSSYRQTLSGRGTINLPVVLSPGACKPGASEVWWASDISSLNPNLSKQHMGNGGVIILEGQTILPVKAQIFQNFATGLTWEQPKRRGTLFRSFYLLQSFDGCATESTQILSLRKKSNAHSPVMIATSARFLSDGDGDCFIGKEELRERSFINLWYSLLVTDYKEDQMQLPEILSRVRKLGLEP